MTTEAKGSAAALPSGRFRTYDWRVTRNAGGVLMLTFGCENRSVDEWGRELAIIVGRHIEEQHRPAYREEIARIIALVVDTNAVKLAVRSHPECAVTFDGTCRILNWNVDLPAPPVTPAQQAEQIRNLIHSVYVDGFEGRPRVFKFELCGHRVAWSGGQINWGNDSGTAQTELNNMNRALDQIHARGSRERAEHDAAERAKAAAPAAPAATAATQAVLEHQEVGFSPMGSGAIHINYRPIGGGLTTALMENFGGNRDTRLAQMRSAAHALYLRGRAEGVAATGGAAPSIPVSRGGPAVAIDFPGVGRAILSMSSGEMAERAVADIRAMLRRRDEPTAPAAPPPAPAGRLRFEIDPNDEQCVLTYVDEMPASLDVASVVSSADIELPDGAIARMDYCDEDNAIAACRALNAAVGRTWSPAGMDEQPCPVCGSADVSVSDNDISLLECGVCHTAAPIAVWRRPRAPKT